MNLSFLFLFPDIYVSYAEFTLVDPSRRVSSRLSISPVSTTDERLRPESVVDLAQSFYGIVKRYAEPLNNFFADHYPKSRLVSSLSMSLVCLHYSLFHPVAVLFTLRANLEYGIDFFEICEDVNCSATSYIIRLVLP